MDKNSKTICVFCGASFGHDPAFRAAATAIGTGIARLGHALVFGGGTPGLMGVTALAARENGSQVTGILPDFLRYVEPPLAEGETTEIVADLYVRKQQMIARSDAFLVLPGGLGTYDEFFEVLTAAQLSVHAKPIIVVNVKGYFDPLEAMIRHTIAAGFARPDVRALYALAEGPDAALDILQQHLT